MARNMVARSNNDESSFSRHHSVRFYRRTKIYLIPALDDLTSEEVASAWASDEDNTRMEKEIADTIRTMRKSPGPHTDDSVEFCSRGLEPMQSVTHFQQHKMNKEGVFNAVFAEQDRQEDAGVYNEAKIAAASMQRSEWARMKAQALGSSDEACVHHLNHSPVACIAPQERAQ